jgi:hypothetical protein
MPAKYFLNGDDAYPSDEHMLTPFPGRGLSKKQDDFNFYQSSTRIRIEMAFGRLMQRFGILWRPLRCKLEFVPAVVQACMILHNLCFDNVGENFDENVDTVAQFTTVPGFASVPDGIGGSPGTDEQSDCYQLDDEGNRVARASARLSNKKANKRRDMIANDLERRDFHRVTAK